MTDTTFDCDDCDVDVSAVRVEAKSRCEQWNWNCSLAEIASELIEAGIEPGTVEFDIYGEEFVRFFGASEPRAADFWKVCGQIIDTFGG